MALVPEQYNLSNFIQAVRNPAKFLDEAHRHAQRFYPIPEYGRRLLFNHRYGPGTDFIEEDWDTLIILDACRYDEFARQSDLDGSLQSRISRGSQSIEFMEENFQSKRLHDTVYVTGNPHTAKLDEETFHAMFTVPVEPLEPPAYEGFPPNSRAVRPEDVVERAKQAYENFPDKRLVVHFMTPHTPYLGETGAETYSNLHESRGDLTVKMGRGANGNLNLTVSQIMNNGAIDISDETLKTAYRENIDIVLKHVEELLAVLSGKTVVTADHGEFLGETVRLAESETWRAKTYGHFRVARPELRDVPWLVVEQGDRREVTSEPPVESERFAADEVEQQLEALGYA
ncbi:alkaline phosphatase family protein [Halorubrum pallidum]|uniref:Sulfatase N-terminal domain-containing protein n=1 Tax=Halorubrum pallidum TaxID=1526114 RepID=A0ABD5T7E0_9EURY